MSDIETGEFILYASDDGELKIDVRTLDPMTDRPEHILGFLSKTGLQFNFDIEHTGTEGTYIDSRYQFKEVQK
ncbi:hypothetical protein [Acinetobacter sp. WCHAc060025]|uniref:hypothetical protein n=1 Tax=Acinetobacter sp. WCHAc060025 TaxID=2518625 RepID=UPI0010236CC2|nr:hypothetical protein [Acinetobacter sp. WCHAc060025]RZG73157.1 hypothetical protein EXE09_15435 [Acinetobacter sp. WCHAc060025]